MNDLDYIFAVARIRVREKTLLRDTDIAQMITMPSADQVLDFLQQQGWGEGLGEGRDAEALLSGEEAKTLALMQELKLDPEFLLVLSYPQLFHNLKAGIKETVTEEPHPQAFFPLEDYGREKMLKILKEKTYEQLPEALQDLAPRAFELMLKTRDGQSVDMLVDRETLSAMEKAGNASSNPLFKNYLQSTVAYSDIKIAVRCRKMKKSRAFIENALAPSSLLDTKELARAASEGEEEFYTFLRRAGYEEGVEALKTSASAGIPGYIDAYLYAEKVIPRHEAVSTDEAAQAAVFLLSPRSSGINAQTIVVDAGMSINYFDRNIIQSAVKQQ